MSEKTPQEIALERAKLCREANGFGKPERIPNLSFFVTWKVYDAGYKMSEALNNYDIMEKCVREHIERYQPDFLVETGTRNPWELITAMGASNYYVNDEVGGVAYKEIPMAGDHEDLHEIVKNPKKFIWEHGMAAKFSRWNENFTVEDFQKAYDAYNSFFRFAIKMGGVLKEYGMPNYSTGRPYCYLGAEYLFNHIRGVKGFAVDMRKDPELFTDAVLALQSIFYDPQLEAMKASSYEKDMNAIFDYTMDMLAHTFMGNKQFERWYLPYLDNVVREMEKRGFTMRLFTQGHADNLFQYWTEYKKGTLCIHSEFDDILDVRKALPNCGNMGGMPVDYLGRKSKEECLQRLELLCKELAPQSGWLLAEDKQVSYKHDCKRENYLAVCEYIREFRPEYN